MSTSSVSQRLPFRVMPRIARTFVSTLSVLTLLVIGGKLRADEELTLELPPSQAAQEAKAAAKAKATAAHTSVVPSRYRSARQSRGNYPSRGGQQVRERTVGRLGQLSWTTPIYRRPSSQSDRLIQAPAGTYLAIQEERGEWVGVLMADGSTGWLNRQNVQRLDYQVTTTQTFSPPTGSDAGDIYPRSNAPYFTGDPEALLQEAYKYVGVRYVWGGNTKNGIDCSGFVKNVFGANGFPLPRLGSDQMAYGVPVPFDQLQAGDRLYFDRRTERVGVKHTGLYIGNGLFIHSSTSNKGVAVDRLTDAKWMHLFVCARR